MNKKIAQFIGTTLAYLMLAAFASALIAIIVKAIQIIF